MRISDENWTIVIGKFANPTSFVFHLAHSVIKLKYDPREGERASLRKEKTTRGGGECGWESVWGGGLVLKAGRGAGPVAPQDRSAVGDAFAVGAVRPANNPPN
ncbi:hypothetical protein AVEN_181185-1 [Araneus ventricosus]|uniref:Uncharacterized protein n=1 Tax=Araneus ventricosus TaxID=182803 RepID=A0A4Y2PFG8_ARAVE|nr:hypothetical protein AVEN_122710-1 [Araneus ventricosus]GBN50793.1 hypothetical protein AVEN_181185-1 [Araneus ventricosus]